MAANHKVGSYVILYEFRPVGIHFPFNIERRLLKIGKRIMADDYSVLNTFGGIFRFTVFYHSFYKFSLPLAEAVATNSAAVFGVTVVLILAAVEHQPPNTAHAEGIISVSVQIRRIVGKSLGIKTPS